MTDRFDFAVLGGGLAGLTLADTLAAAGRSVVVLEAENEVGGLARNIEIEGNIFDIGGHRFFSANEEINRWLHQLMGDELITVERKSRILINGRFALYPLELMNALLGLGLKKSTRVALGYAATLFASIGAQDNFEQWVVARFGRPLYDIYFGPYTRKAWGRDPRLISSDWAAQRIQHPSLAHAVVKAFLKSGDAPKTYARTFLYPRRGIGRISLRLRERIERSGGMIRTGFVVDAIRIASGGGYRIASSGGGNVHASRVVSTIPLTHLAAMLGEAETAGRLAYRSLRCVMLLLDRKHVSDDTWIYLPEEKTVFARMHEPKNWSPNMVSSAGTSLCLEIFCDEGDVLWSMPSEDLHRRCIDDLAVLGFIRADEVRRAVDVRVRNAYPVYLVGYREALNELVSRIERHPAIHILGRTGAFTYANMDQVVEQALALAKRLVREK